MEKIHYLHAMESTAALPIGIMADSHGNNRLLLSAVMALKALGAELLIHLGDLCDSLSPRLAGQSLDILDEHGVRCVRGNNESDILHHNRGVHAENEFSKSLSRLQALPYTIRLGNLWFTHSAPFDYPAATKRPISEFLPQLTGEKGPGFSILFRGHSHQPSIMEVLSGTRSATERIPIQLGDDICLDRNRRYIITAGAVESASSLLFLPREYAVRFVAVPGPHT